MKTSDFSFKLPDNLIAQHPTETRGTSRMMVVNRERQSVEHGTVSDLADILDPGTLMVFNDSKVRKARLFGRSIGTGSSVEFLLIGNIDGISWRVMTSRSKRQRTGKEFEFPDGLTGKITAEENGAFRTLSFSSPVDDSYLDVNGHIPLPPYIRREDGSTDWDRYQTVYARKTGSSAAPTAGLHFTGELIEKLRNNGVETAFVTLHVGLGTFLPVRTENLEDHRMHEEEYCIDDHSVSVIERAKKENRKIVAVGTTSVRTLESAWGDGGIRKPCGKTDIFIYPGYSFKVVDRIFTNFHTPESSLLMLVAAFAGKELIDRAYGIAVEERYRFFSYGDAMYIV